MTLVEIVNMALGFLGEDSISTLADSTKRATLANACYGTVRDAILEERDWQFASLWAVQATAATTSKNPLAVYQCSKPTGTLAIRKVCDGDGEPLEWMLEGESILTEETVADAVATDTDGVYVHVTQQITDTAKWPSNFVLAFAHRLAAVLAVPLCENRALEADQWRLYQMALDQAVSADSMQGRPVQGPYVSTLKNAREA